MSTSVQNDASYRIPLPDATERPISLRSILVIYVGGTLGMVKDEHYGLKPSGSDLYLATTMRSMPELNDQVMVPRFDVMEFEKKLDSTLMGPSHWKQIAKVIATYYFDYDGFVIAHGTDTMHITASALSFLLENLAKPVILTGAMLPLEDAYNDARRNLVLALTWAVSRDICEVCIFSNEYLLRGNRSVKVRHTLSAFESPNYKPLVDVGQNDDSNALRRDLLRPQPRGAFKVRSSMEGNVMTILCHPDFAAKELHSVAKRMDAIIFEVLGVGDREGHAAKILKEFVGPFVNTLGDQSSTPKLLCVTTPELNGYLSQSQLQHLSYVIPGVLFLGDMTTDCAAVKARYLFGLGLPFKDIQIRMISDLRGEVSRDSGPAILGQKSRL